MPQVQLRVCPIPLAVHHGVLDTRLPFLPVDPGGHGESHGHWVSLTAAQADFCADVAGAVHQQP